MSEHARLSPSSSHRWLQCPASVRLSESLYGDNDVHSDSVYAAEGTMAHEIAYIQASWDFGLIDRTEYERLLHRWMDATPEEYQEDMIRHADEYVEFLQDLAAKHDHPQVLLEQKVDSGVTAVWGTLDAAIISADRADFVDYKYGSGIRVEATQNPQLMLYALGALDMMADIFTPPDAFIWIYQPRMDNTSTWHIVPRRLHQWRRAVAQPAAELALSDDAYFAPSEEACRFCPAAGDCRARMEYMTKRDFGNPDAITPEELGQALALLPDLSNWAKAIEKRALQLVDAGTRIPGWKRVRSGGKRQIVDEARAIRRLSRAGFRAKDTVRVVKQLRPFGELDRLVGGKARLESLLGDTLGMTEGREALVPEDDPRDEIDPNQDAAKDFS